MAKLYTLTDALTLKVLGAIECLLLLQQEGVAQQRQTANGLAVRWVWPWNPCTSVNDSRSKHACIIEQTVIVGEIGIVFLLLAFIDAGQLGCNLGRASVSALEELTMLLRAGVVAKEGLHGAFGTFCDAVCGHVVAAVTQESNSGGFSMDLA